MSKQRTKVTRDLAERILKMLRSGATGAEVAAACGVCPMVVSEIRLGRRFPDMGPAVQTIESLPGEGWRPAGEFTGYAVSSEGRVRHETNRVGSPLNRILKGRPNRKGYLAVALWAGRIRQDCRIHRLVAEAFIGPMPAGMTVNHKDGNKQNNRAANLEYVTNLENMAHAKGMGLIRSHRGSAAHQAKTTEAAVASARAMLREGKGNAEIEKACGLTSTQWQDIKQGRTWKHVK